MPCRPDIVEIMSKYNPFQYQYAFATYYPLSLFRTTELRDSDMRKRKALGCNENACTHMSKKVKYNYK